jgi:thiosulfate/3-mercaptopyruvate sulfurtransferase
LIEAADLVPHLDDPDWVVVDCRYSLFDQDQGRRAYAAAHIPRAVYAHTDHDLSAPPVPGQTGRHPLPAIDVLAAQLGRWGIGPGVQVVAYDDADGSFAVRLWWLARWLGHDAVAVLDGGWQAWCAAGLPVTAEPTVPTARVFVPAPQPHLVATLDDVLAAGAQPRHLFDVRVAERFRGEWEPIDLVAGHIPGAGNVPYKGNVGADGRFLPVDVLHTRYTALLGDTPPGEAVFYCGSGINAAHAVLAVAHAGLGDTRLYPGSWSEWITDPARPVATGD